MTGNNCVAKTWAVLAIAAPTFAAAPLGTAFTYQGQLKQQGAALNDSADFQFILWDAAGSGDPPTGGNQVGAPVAVNNVAVVNGLFSVELDFGAAAFNGEARWLQIAVRSPAGGGTFTTLTPRQPIAPAPYAIQTHGIYVDDDQEVGIGNTDPQTLLHVGGSYTPTVSGSLARIAGMLAVQGDIVGDGGNILSRAPSGARAAVVQVDASNDSGGTGWHIVSNATSSPYGGAAGSLTFFADGQNHLTLDQSGRAGIGTPPTSFGRLTVQQDADSANEGVTVVNTGVVRTFRMWVDSANVARLDSGGGTGHMALNAAGGDVGIATADPQAQLHVASGSDVGPASGGYLILGQITGLNIGIDNNEIMGRDNGAAATLHLQADGGTVAVANSGDGTFTMGGTVELVSSEGGSDGAQMRLSDAAGSATFELDAEEGGGGSVAFLRNSLNNTTIELDSDESDDAALRLNDSTGANRVQLRANSSSAGRIDVRGSNGNYNVVLTRENASANHGWIDVSDANGNPQAGCYVNSSGNGVVWGDTKSFRVPNPQDANTEIWYACVEGPEAAAYVRGTAPLENGRAVVVLPRHFQDVAIAQGMTVQVTPRSAAAKGLAVVQQSLESFEVRELFQGLGSYEFHWEVKAVRRGHEEYRVIRERAGLSRGLASEPASEIDE